MRKLLPILVVGAVGMFMYQKQQRKVALAQAEAEAELVEDDPLPERDPAVSERYQCDGRQHCSQMHSCKEALWFLEHCPGMKMDGDNDSIPCEDQHCRHLR